MDAKLVEEITRLVIEKIKEYSNPADTWDESSPQMKDRTEYLPLTKEDVKQWNRITTSFCFSKEVKVESYHVPLTNEELKKWKELSLRIAYRGKARTTKRDHSEFLPLSNEELKAWDDMNSIARKKDTDSEKVRIFPHH